MSDNKGKGVGESGKVGSLYSLMFHCAVCCFPTSLKEMQLFLGEYTFLVTHVIAGQTIEKEKAASDCPSKGRLERGCIYPSSILLGNF